MKKGQGKLSFKLIEFQSGNSNDEVKRRAIDNSPSNLQFDESKSPKHFDTIKRHSFRFNSIA